MRDRDGDETDGTNIHHTTPTAATTSTLGRRPCSLTSSLLPSFPLPLGYDETILPLDHESAGEIVDDDLHAMLVPPTYLATAGAPATNRLL